MVAAYIDDFDDFALIQQGGSVAQSSDNAHYVGYDDDGYVEAFVDVAQTFQDAARGGGVEGGSGFVGEDDLRLGRERAGDADTLFLPVGKLGGIVADAFGQSDDFETFGNARFDFFRRPSGDLQWKATLLTTVRLFNRLNC